MRTFLFFGIVLILSSSVDAQSSSRYCMTVRDWLGATIPKASVKLLPTKGSGSRKSYQLIANDNGVIDIEIIGGMYDIEVSADGHKKRKLKRQLLPNEPKECIEARLDSAVPPHRIT